MSGNKDSQSKGSLFVRRARQFLAGVESLDVQFLCDLSRDKVTRSLAEICREFEARVSDPSFAGLALGLDRLLDQPDLSLDQALEVLRSGQPEASGLMAAEAPAWEDSDQIFGEVPDLGELGESDSPDPEGSSNVVQDLFTAVWLTRLLQEHRDNQGQHLKQVRDILSFYSEHRPEFLLVIGPLLKLVADQGFAIIERGRASRALVNNFNIEQLLIYAALTPVFPESEKQYIFSWLTAYQKLYRRIESLIYDQKAEKVTVARTWFGTTLTELRRQGRAPFDMFELSGFILRFVEAVLQGDRDMARDLGRALVLTTNNEDIIRGMHEALQGPEADPPGPEPVKEVFSFIFDIMQDYRMICIEKKKAQLRIKGTFARISHSRRDMERILTGGAGKEARTPVLGRRVEHSLMPETRENLERYGLLHLFEIWPLPETSQTLFNEVCQLKGMIPRDTDHSLGFLLYMEKFLELLMRLDRLGIRVVKHDALDDLLTNAYQIHGLHLLKEGMYLGSTGYWRSPNQRPPAVICITNPGALMNCLNLPMRHINFRVFLGTGQFYESPFILDSTERYGSMDEQGGPEQLFMRPGLFFLDIPTQIERHWRQVQQAQQTSPHFASLVQMRAQKG
jgi:hypothetical protein